MGRPQRGQTRRPASTRRGDSGRIMKSAVLDGVPPAIRFDQALNSARSVVVSSSVGASGWPGGGTTPPRGTGTIRPQSGHLPLAGGFCDGTFNRRPHGQKNRMNPSLDAPGSAGGAAALRIRTRAPHFGQTTRSEPAEGDGNSCPHRQIARAMNPSLKVRQRERFTLARRSEKKGTDTRPTRFSRGV